MRKLTLMMLLLVGMNALASQTPTRDLINRAGSSEKYPGANYVTIYDSVKVDMQESGLSYYNEHKLVKILSAEGGKRHNVFKYDYDPLSAYAEIQKVVIYYKNGTQKTLTLDDEMDYPAPGTVILWGARQKMVELGRLEAGDAYEIEVFKKGFTYALLQNETADDERYIPPMRGHFYDIVPFWSSEPVLKKVYQVKIPNTKEVQYKVYKVEAQVVKKNLGEKTLYKFMVSDIKPIKRERGMVATSDVATKLLISTSPDWYAKSKWFYGVNEDYGSFESIPEVDKKVAQILKGATTEMDSVSRLTHWVADELRYFGLSMGEGEGFTLHNAKMNFTDRCGVCKDKAGMLVCMLRAAGFESYAAMTMAGSRIDRIPADQFNHSVTLVKLSDGKLHLLDPTWVPLTRELWASSEQQQNYLPGLPEGSDLLETPISAPENHYVKINSQSVLQGDGSLKGEITIEAEGQSDVGMRALFTSRHKKGWKKTLEDQLLSVHPQAKVILADYGNDPYDYMAGPILLKIGFEIPDYAVVTDKEMVFTPMAVSGIFQRAMGHLRANLSLEEREFSFRDHCSRQVIIVDKTTLPQKGQLAWSPELEKVDGSGASFEAAYTLENGVLTLTGEANFNKRVYTPEDWPSYKKAAGMHKKLTDNPVIIKVEK